MTLSKWLKGPVLPDVPIQKIVEENALVQHKLKKIIEQQTEQSFRELLDDLHKKNGNGYHSVKHLV